MAGGRAALVVGLALVAGAAVGALLITGGSPESQEGDQDERPEVAAAPALAASGQKQAATRAALRASTLAPDIDELAELEEELFVGRQALPSGDFRSSKLSLAKRFEFLDDENLRSAIDFLHGLEAPDVPVARDPRVARYLQFFAQSEKGRRIFQSWLSRRDRYYALFNEAFRERRLPIALEAVALVESGLHPRAKSHAGAAGLWQLMPDTARDYGLRVDGIDDERYDPVRATEAATALLVDLFLQLRDWDLALAAYNAGTTNIESRLARRNARSFWELADLADGLPRETRLYVPKVLAVSVMLRNLQTFGFQSASVPDGGGWVRGVFSPGAPSSAGDLISLVARQASDLELEEPAPRRDSHAYLVELAAPDGDSSEGRAPHAGETSSETVYLVSSGETLSDVALRFGVTEAELLRQNNLRNSNSVRPGQILKVRIPRRAPASDAPSSGPGPWSSKPDL